MLWKRTALSWAAKNKEPGMNSLLSDAEELHQHRFCIALPLGGIAREVLPKSGWKGNLTAGAQSRAVTGRVVQYLRGLWRAAEHRQGGSARAEDGASALGVLPRPSLSKCLTWGI